MLSLLVSRVCLAMSVVEGQILEKGTEIPVSATIRCGETSVKADGNGYFSLGDGADCATLTIASPNHHPQSIAITGFRSPVYLIPYAVATEIVVEDERINTQGRQYSLHGEDLLRRAGGFEDPIRLLQSLPGTVATREYGPNAGSVILRGAAPSETRLFIDGVEVPYLYHFDQYASILQAQDVERINVYPSNFGATYGNATGGIVTIESKEADVKQMKVAVSGNLIVVGSYLSVPTSRGVLALGVRRSHADLYESGNEQYSTWPRFYDFIGRYDLHLTGGHHLRFSTLGAQDKYGRFMFDVDDLNPYERSLNPNLEYMRRFQGGVLRWDWRTKTYRGKTSLALVNDRWTAEVKADQQRRSDVYSWLRHESIWLPASFLELSLGFDQRLGRVQSFAQTTNAYPQIRVEAPLLRTGEDIDSRELELHQGAWIEPRWSWRQWRLQTGVRIQSSVLDRLVLFDPRVHLYYETPFLSAHLGAGRYQQIDTGVLDEPHVSEAYHLSSGFDLAVGQRHQVGVDLWMRDLRNFLYTPPQGTPLMVTAVARGAEMYWDASVTDALWSRASISTTDVSYQEQHLSEFDQPVSLNLLLSWKRSKWDFGARYRYSWGLPVVSPTGSIYLSQQDRYAAVWETFPTSRLPNYQKVDLKVARRWQIKDVRLMGYCEVWYVPQSANYLYPIYNFNFTQTQLVVGPGLVPLVGFRLER